MSIKKSSFVLLAAALTLGSAAQANEQVSLAYEPNTADSTPQKKVSNCTVAVASVKDGRNNKETIGHEFIAMTADNVAGWASASFDRLSGYGFTVVRSDTPVAGSISIAPTLIRAYTFHGPMRINGAVAFDTQLTLPDGKVEAHKFRASGSKTNMAGSTSEYATTLNYAINNAIDKMAQELAPLCGARSAVAANAN